MANSNENAQNPKDDQEKISDEGIHEHSEHTAENKQPESKDNVEKKDESTCLCNFFIKIKEWREARKNKNSKRADENATENNDAAKQEEIKQADMVEQPKEQVKLTDILETVSKILGISAILGTFIGGFFIYNYLNYLGQLSIFPEAIANPSALIATAIVFGFILLCFMMQFILPFLYGCTNAKKTKSSKFDNIAICFLFFSLFLFALFFLCIFTKGIFFIFSVLVIILFNFAFYYLGCQISKRSIEKNILNMFIFTVVFVILIVLISIFDSRPYLIYLSNHFVRFAESPKNSSWYLLHNNFQQNNGSQETNGIDKNDLIKLKQNFKCSILSEKEKKDKNIECSSIPEQRNNALYGYMAWNLGDTKVFCPPTIDNRKADSTETENEDSKTKNEDSKTEGQKEADKLAEECIVISGKALQIMPKGYISTNTDGIDDGNPDNTGHDDPATDINTDVRFKNDLNAQSNAGLNNFNVQPVLPIQSNAKNMSIQINYGNCNHDSPRNKDGHPDIGYTDKKICQ